MPCPDGPRLLTLLLFLGGCTSSIPSPPSPPSSPEAMVPDVVGHGFAIRTHESMAPLERVHEVLVTLQGEALSDEAWRDAGLEVVRIREADLGVLLDRVPAISPPGMVWHGQAMTWRNLSPPPVTLGERDLLMGSEPRALTGGRGGLVGRGWSIMTLDGPRVLLQVVPVLEGPGRDEDRFLALQREFEIGPGELLVLVAGSGTWPHPPPEDTSVEARERAQGQGTLGQLLLEPRTAQGWSRQLLLVTPRFDD